MAVVLTKAIEHFIGTSGDSKPTSPSPGSTFYEHDTGEHHVYTGSAWVQYANNLYTADVFPIADNTHVLGSAALSYKEIHVQTVVYLGAQAGDWVPSVDNTYDLGENSTPLRWKDGFFTSTIFIGGATSNAGMTIGLTIDQDANDNQILAFKSSDVGHGMTGIVETDTYGSFRKSTGGGGGLQIRGFTDTDGSAYDALLLKGYLGENASTTKSTSGYGIIRISAQIKSGSGGAAVNADGNILSVDTNDSTVFIVDEDGDLWINGGITTGGATPVGRFQNFFGGSFTSNGSATFAAKQNVDGALTGFAGDTTYLTGTILGNTIVTQSNSETIGVVSQLYLGEPTITKGSDTITIAATLYVSGSPTEGDTNAAIYVASGNTFLQTATVTGLTVNTIAPLGGSTVTGYATDTGVANVPIWIMASGDDPYFQIGRNDAGVADGSVTDNLWILGGRGAASANGTGVGIAFYLGNDQAAENEKRGSIDFVLVDQSNGAEEARFDFNVMGGGSLVAQVLQIASGGVSINKVLDVGATASLTLSGGVVTATKSNHEIVVEGGTGNGADSLDTINGVVDGGLLFIHPATSGANDQVTVTDAGNLILAGAADFVMDNVNDLLFLRYDSGLTKWVEVSRSSNH